MRSSKRIFEIVYLLREMGSDVRPGVSWRGTSVDSPIVGIGVVFLLSLLAGSVFAQTRENPVSVGGSTAPPKRLRSVETVLPQDFPGETIPIVLELLISPEGQVAEGKALRGDARLAEIATRSAKDWVYEPTSVGGKDAWVRVTATAILKRSNENNLPAVTSEGDVRLSNVTSRDGRRTLALLSVSNSRGRVVSAYLLEQPQAAAPSPEFSESGRVVYKNNVALVTLSKDARGFAFGSKQSLSQSAGLPVGTRSVEIDKVTEMKDAFGLSHEQLMTRMIAGR